MPLSEQEQRLLDEMERNLYHSDADYVATVGARRGRPGAGAIALGVVIGLLGIGALLAGVATRVPVLGILGFVVMFVGVVIAVAPPRRLAARIAPHRRGDADRD
jgi:tetrahydromethanopterin S-methyltransferase subunit G